jgi:hypothetical protein
VDGKIHELCVAISHTILALMFTDCYYEPFVADFLTAAANIPPPLLNRKLSTLAQLKPGEIMNEISNVTKMRF